ncbi:hypothetical protein J6590_094510 [Homalodisca vitripennis]|nr:hypothetical protein J6590_094510 [Homalodisca vitripennis]
MTGHVLRLMPYWPSLFWTSGESLGTCKDRATAWSAPYSTGSQLQHSSSHPSRDPTTAASAGQLTSAPGHLFPAR